MAGNDDDELLAALGFVADGRDPTDLVPRIRDLIATASASPWLGELAYVVRHFSPAEPATTDALVAVAKRAVARYPCPACEQVVLDEPAWHGDSPSDEICPSCGIQFGYDDMEHDAGKRVVVYSRWRQAWLANGQRFVRPRPVA